MSYARKDEYDGGPITWEVDAGVALDCLPDRSMEYHLVDAGGKVHHTFQLKVAGRRERYTFWPDPKFPRRITKPAEGWLAVMPSCGPITPLMTAWVPSDVDEVRFDRRSSLLGLTDEIMRF